MPKVATNPLEQLRELALDLELELCTYSGRGMYGKQCPSISGNGYQIIEEAAQRGVVGAQMESLGLGEVVYWPHLEWDKAYTTTKPRYE